MTPWATWIKQVAGGSGVGVKGNCTHPPRTLAELWVVVGDAVVRILVVLLTGNSAGLISSVLWCRSRKHKDANTFFGSPFLVRIRYKYIHARPHPRILTNWVLAPSVPAGPVGGVPLRVAAAAPGAPRPLQRHRRAQGTQSVSRDSLISSVRKSYAFGPIFLL